MHAPCVRFTVALSWLPLLAPFPVLGQEGERAVQVLPAPRQAAEPEKRIALVMGNAAYADAPLRNPVNDARAMAGKLQACGFEVTELENAGRTQMREAIRRFGARIAEGGVGLFYFAGHGMQVKGRNYLIPIGADIAQEDEVAGEAVEVDAILAKMETARNRLNILILDACRNNPFGRSFRNSQQGLAQVDAPTGTFVAFATAPGRTAADGSGANGLYTQALLHHLLTPGLQMEEVFKRTRAEVLQGSQQQQTPWENSSIVGNFTFVPGTGKASSPVPAALVPAEPGPIHPVSPSRQVPAPTPAELELLEAMREKGGQARAIQLARPLAAKGSLYGTYALGSLSEDPAVSHRAAVEGAKQGIPMAMADLAEILMRAKVTSGDLAEARALLEQASALGEPKAKFRLGAALLMGELGPVDAPGAERLFAEAARESTGYYYGAGCVYWMLELKRTPDKAAPGLTKEEADAKGFAFMARGAELGDIGAISMLSSSYQNGEHGPKDPQKALDLLLEGARNERDPYWTMVVGQFYRDVDDPTYRSGEKAIQWFTKAAGKGSLEALGAIAKMYEDGNLVPKDWRKAAELYQRAAEKGHDESQSALGQIYEEGKGVPRDLLQAYFHYLVAGGVGKTDATRLAKDLPAADRTKVEAKALSWHRRRAEKGIPEDQFHLGEFYAAGLGVPSSPEQAYFWWVLAGDKLPLWRWERERLAKQLTPPERARIEARAAKWKPASAH